VVGVIWGMAHRSIASGIPDSTSWRHSVDDRVAAPGPVVSVSRPEPAVEASSGSTGGVRRPRYDGRPRTRAWIDCYSRSSARSLHLRGTTYVGSCDGPLASCVRHS
jgi:hypothetical protein